ncbi:hypothetical protein [uncultured Hyphomicrobium sp.]|uniref:hypothetical protein n=1 Tax=uncultured Hyphomicrobium sp. TaxID=194373 RepID=UPI0025F43DE7|nr:hypothetical protein [uncultured Hyphomicrobium sp.]
MFRVFVRATAALAAGATMVLAAGQAAAEEIVVTITEFHALDRADDLSSGDFFARIRIDGKAAFSPVLTGEKVFKPNWKLTLPAKSGVNEVNLSLIDKDLTVDDPIDINRVANKRDLDFTVNTKTGKIEGFSKTYKTGQLITRTGSEKKKAAISFKVEVK